MGGEGARLAGGPRAGKHTGEHGAHCEPGGAYFAGWALDQGSQGAGHGGRGGGGGLLLSCVAASLLLGGLVEPGLDLEGSSRGVGPLLVEVLVRDLVVVSHHLGRE